MDIDYLLVLQDFREFINDFLTPFMEWISHFAVNYLLIFPVIIYWCLDKKKGLYTFTSACACIAVNAVIKLTACVYRPWIKDARVFPAGDAITESTGYSFPSGHTSTATPLYGGVAISYKRKKWIVVICAILILITGFSRNYLGVHTPQDVFVALILGALSLFGVHKLFQYLENKPEKEWLFLGIGILFGILALIFISVKSYPMDYVNGQLLVDPEKMKTDGYKDIGMLLALCLGRILEKKFVKFSSSGVNAKGIIITIIGLIPLVVIAKLLPNALASVCGIHLGKSLAQGILILYIVTGWPIVIKLVCNKNKPKEPVSRGIEEI